MSVPFSGRLTRGSGLLGYIHKEVSAISLKPVKRVTFQFDPFREPARPIRDCLYFFSLDKVRNTNPKCVIKTDIVCDKSLPKITVQLENGKSILFEAENLAVEDILKHFNLIAKPLVPKEEDVVLATKRNNSCRTEKEKEVIFSEKVKMAGGGANSRGAGKVVDVIYSQVPSFTDVFDEETFYIFATLFVLGTILVAFILSRFVTLKPVD